MESHKATQSGVIRTAKKFAKQAAALVRGETVKADDLAREVQTLADRINALEVDYQQRAAEAYSLPGEAARKVSDDAAAALHNARLELAHKQAVLAGVSRKENEAKAAEEQSSREARAEHIAGLSGDLHALCEMADDQLDAFVDSLSSIEDTCGQLSRAGDQILLSQQLTLQGKFRAHVAHRLQKLGFTPLLGIPREAVPRLTGVFPDAAFALRLTGLLDGKEK